MLRSWRLVRRNGNEGWSLWHALLSSVGLSLRLRLGLSLRLSLNRGLQSSVLGSLSLRDRECLGLLIVLLCLPLRLEYPLLLSEQVLLPSLFERSEEFLMHSGNFNRDSLRVARGAREVRSRCVDRK